MEYSHLGQSWFDCKQILYTYHVICSWQEWNTIMSRNILRKFHDWDHLCSSGSILLGSR